VFWLEERKSYFGKKKQKTFAPALSPLGAT
jgi:hypothetical protein